MIKILSVHRKLTLDENGQAAFANPNCNVVIAADETYNKGHFALTTEEAEAFDLICRNIENRIAEAIAVPNVGLAALQPREPTAPLAKEATSGR
jgi:hypothetical protein